jgi:hypothetical protein
MAALSSLSAIFNDPCCSREAPPETGSIRFDPVSPSTSPPAPVIHASAGVASDQPRSRGDARLRSAAVRRDRTRQLAETTVQIRTPDRNLTSSARYATPTRVGTDIEYRRIIAGSGSPSYRRQIDLQQALRLGRRAGAAQVRPSEGDRRPTGLVRPRAAWVPPPCSGPARSGSGYGSDSRAADGPDSARHLAGRPSCA